MGFEKKKKICHIRFNASDTPARAFQDCGMFLYTLAKDFNWESTYVFYKTRVRLSVLFTELTPRLIATNLVKIFGQ